MRRGGVRSVATSSSCLIDGSAVTACICFSAVREVELARELPGGLDRLRAAGAEEDAVEVARRERRDLGGELDGARMRVRPVRVEGQLAHLRERGLADLLTEAVAASLFALGFVPAVACALARPRAGQPGDERSIGWTPGAIAAGALLAWQGLFFSSWLGRPLAVALIAAVLLARRDPRLAAGAGCLAALLAARHLLDPYATPWLGTSSLLAPLLIALALASAWRLRPAPALS